MSSSIYAQRQTKSPFSRYGYGDMYSFSSAYTQAMGGIGVGVQNPVQINFSNPAQQSMIKKESFLFNVGLGGNFRFIKDNNSSTNLSSVGLETMSLAFPIVEDRWGCAVGILPFNSVGYEMNYSDDLSSYSYSGDGGINQVALSTGVRLFKGFSVGATASYLFGTTTYLGENYFEESSSFYARKELEYKTLGFLWNLGAQYKININDSKSIVLGVTFRNAQKLTYRQNEYFGSYITGGVNEIQKDTAILATSKSTTDIPLELNVGVSYVSNDKLMVGVDAGMQDWNGISCYGKTDESLVETKYVKFGCEIIPDSRSSKFYKKMPIRFGGHYSELPVVFEVDGQDHQVQEYGFTIGTRVKSKQTQNSMAMALDFGYRGKTSLAKSLHEKYVLLKLNVTLQEVWFTKRKIN
ncbi:MAG: hypothetical protein MJ198_03220 [Bacteroidales bacterium]|nr:hypothetical protein [Bacteroidales bacterium]